jgi:hypothetical protein
MLRIYSPRHQRISEAARLFYYQLGRLGCLL